LQAASASTGDQPFGGEGIGGIGVRGTTNHAAEEPSMSGFPRAALYLFGVGTSRRCSRPSCVRQAVATLTYVYSDSTAVLGPLATYAEPHCYDLCAVHSERLSAPRGWELVRLAPDPEALKPTSDDLEALANAVRDAGRPRAAVTADPRTDDVPPGTIEVGRRGHLRILRSVDAQ
jgi:hypothetical protein